MRERKENNMYPETKSKQKFFEKLTGFCNICFFQSNSSWMNFSLQVVLFFKMN